MSDTIKYSKPVTFMEEVDNGEITLLSGEGSFLFPTDPNSFGFLAKLQHVADPNTYPNCNVGGPEFIDTVSVSTSPEGYLVTHSLSSRTRILEWVLVKYTR